MNTRDVFTFAQYFCFGVKKWNRTASATGCIVPVFVVDFQPKHAPSCTQQKIMTEKSINCDGEVKLATLDQYDFSYGTDTDCQSECQCDMSDMRRD